MHFNTFVNTFCSQSWSSGPPALKYFRCLPAPTGKGFRGPGLGNTDLANNLHVQLFLWHALWWQWKRLNCMWIHGIKSAISYTLLASYHSPFFLSAGSAHFKGSAWDPRSILCDILIVLMSASPKRSEMWWDYIWNTAEWLTGWSGKWRQSKQK